MFDGVNVTLCEAVPAAGTMGGVVKAKLPATEAAPPLKLELARVWPWVMALAVGAVMIVGGVGTNLRTTTAVVLPRPFSRFS